MTPDLPLCLDLFCGTGSATAPIREHGCMRVIGIDLSEKATGRDITADVRRLPIRDGVRPRFIWASPPCTAFSYARHIWHGYPDPEVVPEALEILESTLRFIRSAEPMWWLVENPRGHMQDELGKPLFETPWCAWGKDYKKPTQFWGRFPRNLHQPCRHARHRSRVTFRQTPLTPAQMHRALRSRREAGGAVFEVTTRNPLMRAQIPRAFAEAVHDAVCPLGGRPAPVSLSVPEAEVEA